MFHKTASQTGQAAAQSEEQNLDNQNQINEEETQAMNPQNTAQQNQNNNEESQAETSRQIPGGPSRIPGAAYPGAYPGSATSSYVAPHNPATANDLSSSRKLMVGRGITLSGEIESCDYLVVQGTVEAVLKGASVLEIEEGGIFYGTVEIEEATISGRFEGDLTVSGRLNVTASGSITGQIVYKELALEAGAVIDGKISPLDGRGASPQKVMEANFAGGKGKQQQQQPRTQQQADEQLRFADKTTVHAAE